ncbi:MAG: DNA translocase FtsK [Candidatus Pelagibacter sp. TMED196]|nr:MAG: DNA translocase FtsK [Candidatus Pelagibacter sp. TMED196]|tara:strand:- start:1403 stop:3475 length:2073 start_codon:yes stop_codon:yes gene_type:complete
MIRKFKLNKDIYSNTLDFLRKRFVEVCGLILISIFAVFSYSLINYSPKNGTLIYKIDEKGTGSLFDIYSNISADFFLQSFGLISFLIALSVFSWGVSLILNKKINKFLSKLFYTIVYVVLGCLFIYVTNNNSFWLIDNGNSGFIGEKSYLLLQRFEPIIESNLSKVFLCFFTLTFFVLASNINLKYIFSKIFKKKKNVEEKDVPFDDNDEKDFKEIEAKQQSFLFKNDTEITNIKKNIFDIPSIKLLEKKQPSKNSNSKNPSTDFIEKILLDFGIKGKIKKVSNGPVVSLYEFEPAAGIKVSKIINLSEDIARNTSSLSARVAIIPGKNTVGIEIPNEKRDGVVLSEILESENFFKSDIKLPIALGKSISGYPIIADLTSMPHLLIAGTTGSGKSVCINTIISSLLFKHNPDICKFILIDPKMLELSSYEGIPHLLTPVITDAKKATAALSWTVREMENRYKLMSSVGVRNIDSYNQKHKIKMPYIIVVVDEMSDLMLISGKEIESYVQKLSAMARAAGIHIIMATQRPSVDVITGTIKANFPTRVSFQVSSKIDSKTILGEQGAEQLLGKGDMLFMSSANKIFRIHGPYISENEIEKVTSFLRAQGNPDYIEEITLEKGNAFNETNINESDDNLYQAAIQIVKTEKKASTSFLQRKLQIGYNRAARMIDQMEESGIVSKANHTGKREVL